jgi:nitrogen fixation protein NifZ
VVTRLTLAVNGEVLAAAGTEGEVFKVLRELADGVQYHVRFPGHTLQVPETCLGSPVLSEGEAPAKGEAHG